MPTSSFSDLQTVDGIIHRNFQDTAIAAGLFVNQNKAEYTIQEAVDKLATPRQLRFLFMDLLVNDCVPSSVQIWTTFHNDFCRDFELRIGIEVRERHSLMELQHLLDEHGKSLGTYKLPEVHCLIAEVEHKLVLWNSGADYLATHATALFAILNTDQKQIFLEITAALSHWQPMYMFVDGKAD